MRIMYLMLNWVGRKLSRRFGVSKACLGGDFSGF